MRLRGLAVPAAYKAWLRRLASIGATEHGGSRPLARVGQLGKRDCPQRVGFRQAVGRSRRGGRHSDGGTKKDGSGKPGGLNMARRTHHRKSSHCADAARRTRMRPSAFVEDPTGAWTTTCSMKINGIPASRS